MSLQPSLPQCPQCGKFHPPLQEGEDCPLKGTNDGTGVNNQVDVGNFLAKMKSILLNNIEKKEIKDLDKFQNHLVVELNKIIENYHEE